tara:strand:- start:162 stop:2006 length:1845 start_codon:yes stop_codon:yes gene_type:complete
MTLFEELKRRKVFRVAGTYAIVAWILMQIGEVTFPALNIPEWIMSTLVVVLLAGFPIAVIFAWIFDRTPSGIVRTPNISNDKGDDNSGEWFSNKRTYFAIIGVLFGFLIGVYGPNYIKDRTLNNYEEKTIQKLAILPFSNIRPDNETDFLGYALSDEIINRLSYIKSLIVRPSTAVRQYRDLEVSPEKVGDELEVNLILTGSYLRNEDRLRLNTELMDITKKELVWSKSMTVDYNDIFAIQDSVANSIISELEGQLNPDHSIDQPLDISSNPKSYELYLKAKSIDFVVLGDLRRKISLLNQSIKLDNKFAPSWGELGRSYRSLANRGLDADSSYARGERALKRALELNPTLIMPYQEFVLLYSDTNRLIEAYSIGKRGLKLAPNDPNILQGMSYVVKYAGLHGSSKFFAKKSTEVQFDPYKKVSTMHEIPRSHLYSGDIDGALLEINNLVDYISEEGIETSPYDYFYKGLYNYYKGNYKTAIESFDICYSLDPTQTFSNYGIIYKKIAQGDKKGAIKAINDVEKRKIYDGEQYYRQIHFYALLGMKKKAIEKMRGTLARGFFPFPYFNSDKLLDSIREEPEFKELISLIRARHIEFKTLFESTMDVNLLTDATD